MCQKQWKNIVRNWEKISLEYEWEHPSKTVWKISPHSPQPKDKKIYFLLSAHETFAWLDHMLKHKSAVYKVMKIEVRPSVFFSDQIVIKEKTRSSG